jgi:hypothetical protein
MRITTDGSNGAEVIGLTFRAVPKHALDVLGHNAVPKNARTKGGTQ